MVVSESWLRLPARGLCAASPEGKTALLRELIASAGDGPFAMLYGDGPYGRYWIRADRPLLLATSPAETDLVFERRGDLPPLLPDYIGLVSYEWAYGRESLLPPPRSGPIGLPGFRFMIYGRVLILDRISGEAWEGKRELCDTGFPADERGPSLLREGSFRARKTFDSDDAEGYAAKVSAIRAQIAAGNVYQVNLTRREGWDFEGDLRDFALALYRENPAPFSAILAEPDFTVVSSSPERFVRIADGMIEARPIKGTAPRGATPAEDAALAARLLSSAKDRAELAMIVDLLRNDLARACVVPGVGVDAFPELETYANVHHLVATVRGRPRPGLDLERLLDAVFPGGSITGCPKLASMLLIHELEAEARSVYTGALGWFSQDLAALDFAIPIRTVWADGRSLRFGVGGAVVWDSDEREEYLETVHKGRSIVRCLSS